MSLTMNCKDSETGGGAPCYSVFVAEMFLRDLEHQKALVWSEAGRVIATRRLATLLQGIADEAARTAGFISTYGYQDSDGPPPSGPFSGPDIIPRRGD